MESGQSIRSCHHSKPAALISTIRRVKTTIRKDRVVVSRAPVPPARIRMVYRRRQPDASSPQMLPQIQRAP
jgi:hypothetical protein